MRKEEDVELERRLLVAVLLSMAILFAVPYVYEYFFPSPPVPVIETAQEEARKIPSEVSPVAQEVESAVPVAAGSVEPTKANPEEFVVENESMVYRFSNVGASLHGARWKTPAGSNGEPVEVIPQALSGEYLRPLELYSEDSAIQKKLSTAVYRLVEGEKGTLNSASELVFEYRDEELQLRKRIGIPARGHELKVTIEAKRGDSELPLNVVLGTGIGSVEKEDPVDFREPAIAFFQNGAVERYDIGDVEGEAIQLEGNFRWAAMDSKYFTFLLVEPLGIRSVKIKPVNWVRPPAEGKTEGTPAVLLQGVVALSGQVSFTCFVGPKVEEELRAVDPTAPGLVDYGWFALLVQPLLMALKWIFGYVANYGWAIILLTFFINLALFPVRYKQMASMQKMSVLQPQLKAIQDKYKKMKRDDPRRQQMNNEVMGLYREHGVNPLGGCLPLVIQMPILFAFYRMLDVAIELRGAPFIWWITDLSKADPYYVTPIVMGLTMVLQQKMTPATGDPTQRRMMMFLPIIFTFFFLSVSSGLAVYFLFSNVFAMMLQFGLQKIKPELMPKGGAGKSKQKASTS